MWNSCVSPYGGAADAAIVSFSESGGRRLVSLRMRHVKACGTKEATTLVKRHSARWEPLENGRHGRQASVRHE